MSAYLIAEHSITDAAKFEEYRIKVGPLIAKHGGRCITKLQGLTCGARSGQRSLAAATGGYRRVSGQGLARSSRTIQPNTSH